MTSVQGELQLYVSKRKLCSHIKPLHNKHVFFLDCRYFMVHCYFKNNFVSQVVLTAILLATHWFYSTIELHVTVLTVIMSIKKPISMTCVFN